MTLGRLPDLVTKGQEPWLLQPDHVRSTLAYFLVIGLLAFIIATTFWGGVDSGLKVAGFASGTIGTIVGFYFGRQGFDRVWNQAKTAEDNSTKSSAKYTAADEEAAQLKGELNKLESQLEELAAEYAEYVKEKEAQAKGKGEKA